jgi:hypothetical protein
MGLDKNWLLSEPQDFEYKKYKLLAYFQQVQNDFKENKLYPHLDDIFDLYRDAIVFRQNVDFIQENTRRIKGIENGFLVYQEYEPGPEMTYVLELTDYGLGLFDEHMNAGYILQERMLDSIKLELIGVSPENVDSGFLLMEVGGGCFVYEYEKVRKFYKGAGPAFLDNEPESGDEFFNFGYNSFIAKNEDEAEKFSGMPGWIYPDKYELVINSYEIEESGLDMVQFMFTGSGQTWYKGSPESIKEELNKKKSVPAVYYARTDFQGGLPLVQSFLPLTRKKLEGIICVSI